MQNIQSPLWGAWVARSGDTSPGPESLAIWNALPTSSASFFLSGGAALACGGCAESVPRSSAQPLTAKHNTSVNIEKTQAMAEGVAAGWAEIAGPGRCRASSAAISASPKRQLLAHRTQPGRRPQRPLTEDTPAAGVMHPIIKPATIRHMSAIGLVGVSYRSKFFRGGRKRLPAVYDPEEKIVLHRTGAMLAPTSIKYVTRQGSAKAMHFVQCLGPIRSGDRDGDGITRGHALFCNRRVDLTN